MALQEVLFNLFQNYASILSFLAGLLVGDLVLVLGMLSGAGKINFLKIIIFAFLGGLTHDIIFYFISNSNFAFWVKKKLKLSRKRNKLAQYIEKIGNGNYFLPVLMAKFVYGVRDAVILYVAHNAKKFDRYLMAVSSADFVWLVSIAGVGWLAGNGFTFLVSIVKGFEKWALLAVLGLIFYYFIVKLMTNLIIRNSKKLFNRH